MDFDNVGPLPDGEVIVEDVDEDVDQEECEDIFLNENENTETNCSLDSGFSPTYSTQSSQPSSSGVDKRLLCGQCLERPRDRLMTCGHTICEECFEVIKLSRIQFCDETIRSSRRRRQEYNILNCPFTSCKKEITSQTQTIILDF